MAKKTVVTVEQSVDGVPCVTVAEAARRLGCSRQNIWVRVKRKTIEAVRVGDRIFIPVTALAKR